MHANNTRRAALDVAGGLVAAARTTGWRLCPTCRELAVTRTPYGVVCVRCPLPVTVPTTTRTEGDRR